MMSISFRNWLAAGSLLALGACSGASEPAPPQTVRATVETARPSQIPEILYTAGTVRAATVVPISSRVMGNVTRVLVSAGDRVEAGQILAEIDDRNARSMTQISQANTEQLEQAIAGAESAIASASAQAQVAASTFERYSRLRERGSVSAQEFDEAQARNRAAQSELERARRGRDQLLARRNETRAASTQAATSLDDTRLRSPIRGIVSARFVDQGAQAVPGMPLFTIDGGDGHRVEIMVDERESVRPGDPAIVEIAGQSINARVSQVVASVDATTRSSLVKIELPRRDGLRSGSFARVGLITRTREGISVPATAITRRGQMETLFVVDSSGLARLRLVTLGNTANGRVEVLSGLAGGERVVTGATSALRDGIKIEGNPT